MTAAVFAETGLNSPEAVRAAAKLNRFLHDTTHVHRAKPRVGIVFPEGSAASNPWWRRQWETALPVLAALAPAYVPVLAAGDPDGLMNQKAQPDGAAFLLTVGFASPRHPERSEGPRHPEGAQRPKDLTIATDPLEGQPDKWRIVSPLPPLPHGKPSPCPAGTVGIVLSPAWGRQWAETALKCLADQQATIKAYASPRDLEDWPEWFDFGAEIQVKPLAEPREEQVHGWLVPFEGFAAFDERPSFMGLLQDGVMTFRPSGADPSRTFLYKGEDLNPRIFLDRALGMGQDTGDRARPRSPLISIVVPVYDRTDEITRLANSIFSQSYSNLEVLFVTNGSPPETLETLAEAKALLDRRRIRVHIIEFEGAFGCATIPRDVGICRADGDFVCFIDSDDWFGPDFFKVFEGPCDLETVYYPKKFYHDFGRKMPDDFPYHKVVAGIGDVPQGDLYNQLVYNGNFFANSGIVAPRRAMLRVGAIWHTLKYAEDYYLWLMLAKHGARAIEHDGLVNIALHAQNNELSVGDDRWIQTARDRAEEGLPLV